MGVPESQPISFLPESFSDMETVPHHGDEGVSFGVEPFLAMNPRDLTGEKQELDEGV